MFLCLCSFSLFYLTAPWSFAPKSTRLGFNHAPSCVLQKELYAGHTLFRFGNIGWKPRRKFHSRIRMDGSMVYTRDTTPRTETGTEGCSTGTQIYILTPIQFTVHSHTCIGSIYHHI